MSAHKSRPMSPLRDRLLSNSPTADPVKSSILRESGLGWNSVSPPPSNHRPSTITPLRISKRDSPLRSNQHQHPSQIARRSSSTYKRLGNNNLVSKSPFKSQIPTPSSKSSSSAPVLPPKQLATPSAMAFPSSPTPRKVSGEKRPRPASMQEQAENERPFAYKRERRQSKGYQGLIQKEPVTRSPFRASISAKPKASGSEAPLPPLPAMPTLEKERKEGSPSPTRSSLVSKRLHGPRLSGSGVEGRRQRRKTVTFDEQCDVVEFDIEEEGDEDPFLDDDEHGDSVEMEGEMGDDGEIDLEDLQMEDEHRQAEHQHEDEDEDEIQHDLHNAHPEDSFESIQLGGEADDSITGMVNSMLHNANPSRMSTPPLTPSLPVDLSADAEDGIPYGRTHHSERVRNRESARSPPPRTSSPKQSYPFHSPSPTGDPATPPSHRRIASPLSGGSPISNLSPGSHIPLGRSTHIERARADRQVDEEMEEDMGKLPPSPSPMKGVAHAKRSTSPREGLIPRFGIQVLPRDDREEKSNDPFAIPGDAPHRVELSFNSNGGSDSDSMEMDPNNLSIGHSEVSLSRLEMELGLIDDKPKSVELRAPPRTSTPPTEESDSSYTSLSTAHDSPSSAEDVLPHVMPDLPARVLSPTAPRTASPLRREVDMSGANLGSSGSINGRTPRISREDVQRRLLRKRSVDSPVPEDRSDTRVNEPLPEVEEEEEKKRMSVMTDFDISTETAIVETVERRNVGFTERTRSASPHSHFSTHPQPKAQLIDLPQVEHEGLKLDMSQFGMGSVDVDMRSALDRLMDDVAGSANSKGAAAGLRVEAVTEGVKAGRFEVDDSMMTETTETTEENESPDRPIGLGRPPVRSATAPDLLTNPDLMSPSGSRTASGSTIPPAPPPKDAIRSRQELILAKRREAREREESESLGYYTPPRASDRVVDASGGRPSRRRSRSTGDMEGLARRDANGEGGSGMLDVNGLKRPENDDLGDSIQRELRKLGGSRSTYHIKEQATIYASSDANGISHMHSAGDVNAGKAWRAVRRPSDMNEYSKQIKEFRAQEKPGKAHGKVFVKVVGTKGINVPLPQHATAVTCTLNNGIHFVTTPECRFGRDSRIEQEFELIEHSKLEFTLTLKIRRDPHIISMFKAIAPPPPQPPAAPVSKGGMRSFFSSSPKKSSKAPPKPSPPPPLPENLARYLKPDGTLARAFISFKDVATRCDTKLFETSYPLIGQHIETGGTMSTLQVGELVLQIFRLPPLPGIPQNQLPQSLEECHRGLRHTNWHKMTYFEGTLTQQGGDCTTWRRRRLRVIGANLVAFNDVTKKATATIGLKKAIAVEDDQEALADAMSPTTARSSRYADDYDGVGGVERSFRLIFPDDEEIMFFADTDEEKAKWLEVLRALVGHIPPNPLWAELVWQRQDELRKQGTGSQPSRPAMLPASARSSQDAVGRNQPR